MADIKEILGLNQKSFTADPVSTVSAWASGGNVNTAVSQAAGFGNINAAAKFGGDSGGSADEVTTELYNGTAWTEVNDMNEGRTTLSGAGTTNTAGLAIGGVDDVSNESWNGTSWTELNNLNTARNAACATGSQTAAIIYGGNGALANTETWNGTSWTEVNDLNTGRLDLMAGGTTTAAITFGGTSNTTKTETWNGTSWTEVNNLPAAVLGGWGMGSQTNALCYGGHNASAGRVANTNIFDGTSWAAGPDLGTANYQPAGGVGGDGNTAIQFVGSDSGYYAGTEEFTSATIADTIQSEGQVYYNSTDGTMNITSIVYGTGAWASGGNLNTARRSGGMGADSHSAAVLAGGSVARTELYDGSSWTEVNDLNAGRTGVGAFGSSTSMLEIQEVFQLM